MTGLSARTSLLRPRDGHDHARVTFVELFFDLVFVFAVTQLSHGLLAHLTPLGALQTGLLMLAVWWVWIYTAWITNWLDPEQRRRAADAVRADAGGPGPVGLDPAGLRGRAAWRSPWPMSSCRSAAACSCCGRSKRHDAGNFRNFLRIISLVHRCRRCSGSPADWSDGESRAHRSGRVAIAIEYLMPAVGMWVPGLGRSTTAGLADRWRRIWPSAAPVRHHRARRIAGRHRRDVRRPVMETRSSRRFIVAFLGSVAMWAIYFNIGAERASRQIGTAADPGRLGRSGYTYLHLLIVAGIIVAAVADEIALTHPHGHADLTAVLVIVGGPALYLLGTALFKRLTAPNIPLSHLVGLGLLLALGVGGGMVARLHLATATTVILIIVAIWEWASLTDRGRRPPAHGH